MSSSEYWKGLTHNEIRARVVQYMETLLTQARTLVPYRFSSPATSLPAADLLFWKVSHGLSRPGLSQGPLHFLQRPVRHNALTWPISANTLGVQREMRICNAE